MPKKSAYLHGYQHGVSQDTGNPELETVILNSMRNNPFKSAQSREDYVKGVSEGVNTVGRIRTRKEVYG
jgi:hypothetical protein